MNHAIETQYATGLSRHNIEQALIAAGKDLDHLAPADLGLHRGAVRVHGKRRGSDG